MNEYLEENNYFINLYSKFSNPLELVKDIYEIKKGDIKMFTNEESEISQPLPQGWDVHQCFNIVDFVPGSSIYVNRYGSSKIKGVVLSADDRSLFIKYKTADGSVSSTHINNIGYLGDYVLNWLHT